MPLPKFREYAAEATLDWIGWVDLIIFLASVAVATWGLQRLTPLFVLSVAAGFLAILHFSYRMYRNASKQVQTLEQQIKELRAVKPSDWEDLEQKFGKMPPSISADWRELKWSLHGDSPENREVCADLLRRAGMLRFPCSTDDPMFLWLNWLKETENCFQIDSIPQVAQASARRCVKEQTNCIRRLRQDPEGEHKH